MLTIQPNPQASTDLQGLRKDTGSASSGSLCCQLLELPISVHRFPAITAELTVAHGAPHEHAEATPADLWRPSVARPSYVGRAKVPEFLPHSFADRRAPGFFRGPEPFQEIGPTSSTVAPKPDQNKPEVPGMVNRRKNIPQDSGRI